VRHRGHYKRLPTNVEAFDDAGRSVGVIFQTASHFETPAMMRELVHFSASSAAEDG